MDAKLTTRKRKTSDHRIACSDFHKGSIVPPNGPGSRIIRERSSEDPGSGGSDRRRSSRRIQEGRSNRSGRVGPDPEIRTSRRPSPFPSRSQDRKASSRKRTFHVEASPRDNRHPRRSPALGPEAMAGVHREIPAAKLPRLGNRIHGSSVQSVSGRRRPERTPLAIDRYRMVSTTRRMARVIRLRSFASIT